MSTNDKNIVRSAFLMNFTKNLLSRFIVASDTFDKKDYINRKIGVINSQVNYTIHRLNLLVHNRNLPFIKVKALFSKSDTAQLEKDTRIVIDQYPENDEYDDYIKNVLQISRDEISHVIDVLLAYGQNMFTVSSLSCDARLVLDDSFFETAIEDILLDISVFNSYSFLRDISVSDRINFSQKKVEFCQDQEIKFYNVESGDKRYFSLAFVARDENGEIDLDKYVQLWDDFISKYYGNCVHKELSVKEQLLYHRDYEELPKTCKTTIMKKGNGTYLLLRTNKDKTESLHPQLYSYFGIGKKKSYRKGLILVVPISEYDNVYPLLEHLDVSAFKVIVSN